MMTDKKIQRHGRNITSLCVTGKYIVSGSADQTVCLTTNTWDLQLDVSKEDMNIWRTKRIYK